MLKEICEHLGLRDTIQSRKFVELVKATDVSQLAENLERTLSPGRVHAGAAPARVIQRPPDLLIS